MNDDDDDLAGPVNARVACIQSVPDPDGQVYSIVLAEDGETFESYVFHHIDMTREGTLLYRSPGWFKALHRADNGRLFVVDAAGAIHSDQTGTWQEEDITGNVGLTDLRRIGGLLHATADDGSIWRHVDQTWRSIGVVRGPLYSIDGSGLNEICVVGEDGVAARFDGARWHDLALPTNLTLTSVLAAPTGDWFIAGERGAFFVGSRDLWQQRDDLAPDTSTYGLAWYMDRLVMASAEAGVLSFDGRTFAPVHPGLDAASVAAAGRFLGVAVDDQAWRFDGQTWESRTFSF